MYGRRTVETYFTEAGHIYLVRVENVVELAQSAINPIGKRTVEHVGQLAYLFRRMLIFSARVTHVTTKRGSSGVDLTAAPYQHSVGVRAAGGWARVQMRRGDMLFSHY